MSLLSALVNVDRMEIKASSKIHFMGNSFYYTSAEVYRQGTGNLGFAVSKSRLESAGKAVMEAYERSVDSGQEYAGFASGFSRQRTRLRALNEALERDTYLRWYTGYVEAHSEHKAQGVRTVFVRDIFGVGFLAICMSADASCVKFGLGFGADTGKAHERAYNELVLSHIRHLSRGRCEPIPGSAYDQLHELTKIKSVREWLLTGRSKPRTVIREVGKQMPHFKYFYYAENSLLPIYSLGVRSPELHSWDLLEMLKPIGSSKFSSPNCPPEIQEFGIPVG